MPTISWRRADGVTFGRKVDMNKASGVLEIPYFQQEDAGLYECVAENSRGRNSVKGKLSFYGGWEETLNVFVLPRREPITSSTVSREERPVSLLVIVQKEKPYPPPTALIYFRK